MSERDARRKASGRRSRLQHVASLAAATNVCERCESQRGFRVVLVLDEVCLGESAHDRRTEARWGLCALVTPLSPVRRLPGP